MDFWRHLATSIGVEIQTIEDICTREITQQFNKLDLVIIKVSGQPDCKTYPTIINVIHDNLVSAFTSPSLASIFPFLEAVRPQHDRFWHIRTARLLKNYDCAWFLHSPDAGMIKPLAFGEHVSDIGSLHSEQARFLCVLFPKSWSVQGSCDLESTCTHTILSGKTGCVLSWEEFRVL